MQDRNQSDLFNLPYSYREERPSVTREASPVDVINMQFINGAMRMLEKAGASFKIQDKYGALYGTLVITEVKKPRKKRVTRYKRGELVNFYMPFVEKDTPVGGQFFVPAGNYPPEHVRSALCSTLSGLWGLKSYTTTVDNDLVLVTRLK